MNKYIDYKIIHFKKSNSFSLERKKNRLKFGVHEHYLTVI